MLSLQIRQAAGSDARAVTEVILASRKHFLPFAPLAHDNKAVFDWIQGWLIPQGRVLVAVLDYQVVGMCATLVQDGIGWIDQLYPSAI